MPQIDISDLRQKDFITLTNSETGDIIKVIAPSGLELGIDDAVFPGAGLKLPSKAAPAVTTNKLYNENGVLKFNGVVLISGSVPAPTAGGWTDAGGSVYLTTSTDKVGIGVTDPETSLEIVSNHISATQLTMSSYGAQTSTFTVVNIGDATWASSRDITLDSARDVSIEADSDIILDAGGNVGIGVTDPDTQLEVLSTSTQLKLSYDDDNASTFAVASNGDTTWAAGRFATIDAANDIYLDAGGNHVIFAYGGVNAAYINCDIDPRLYFYTNAEIASAGTLKIDSAGTLELECTGDFTVDASADIFLQAGNQEIYIDSGGEAIYLNNDGTETITFNLDSTPQIDMTGNSKIDSSGTLELECTGDLTLDASGNVLQPNQPAFLAYATTDQPILGGAFRIVQMNAEAYDVGGDYAIGTYKFTAPVDGKYLLMGNVRIDDIDSANPQYIWASIDTTARRARSSLQDLDNAAEEYWSVQCHGIFDMDANDTASFQVRIATTADPSTTIVETNYDDADDFENYFCGYLLG